MREGWELKRLGEVCELIKRGIAPKYTEDRDKGLCVINQKCIRDHKINLSLSRLHDKSIKVVNPERLISVGDVLINSTGTGTLGRVAQVREIFSHDCTVDTHVTIVRPLANLFYNDFFGYALIKIEEEITQSGEGTSGQTELPRKKLENNFYISYPKSLPEQTQIVNTLDKAFKQIDQAKVNLEKNLHNAKELLESYLQSLFLNNLSGQESVSLNNICELIVDCEHKTAPTQDEGYPSIRTPNIGFGVLLLDNVNRVSKETYTEWTRRAMPQADDLILAREAPAGNIAVIPENIEVCLGQRTVLLRPKKDITISKYLAFIILSKDVQSVLLSHSKGATVGHINMKDIRAFKLYNLPSLEEQNKIVSDINNVYIETQKLQTHYQHKLNNLEELKKSILQKAFAGEL